MQISYKHICKITIPVLVSLLVEYLIGFTDTAYLGRVGETELAASALAGTYYMIIYMIGFGFSIGAQILIARYNGSRQYSRTGEVFTQGTIFLLLVATLLFTLSYLYSPVVLRFLIDSEQVYLATISYLNWRIYGFFFSFIIVMFRAFFIGTVNTKILTINSIVMVLTNIILNYILIFGKLGFPALGIAGAAIASSISEAVAVIFFLVYTRLQIDDQKYCLFQQRETTRDWGHVQLGIGEFAKAAQTADTQGLDFYSVADDRLAQGFEYTARFMLGEHIDLFGVFTDRDNDKFRDIYESIYQHYKNTKGLLLPYTEKAIKQHTRPKSSVGFLTAAKAPLPNAPAKTSLYTGFDKFLKPTVIGALKGKSKKLPANSIFVKPGESIQEAIDSNQKSGKWIILEAGVHTLKAPLKIYSGTLLAGQGRETIIFPAPQTETAIINGEDILSDVTIRDLLIEGATKVIENADPNHDRRSRSYMNAPSREGIIFKSKEKDGIQNITFENITVQNFTKNGVAIVGGKNIRINQCDFSDNGASVVPGAGFHHNLHLSYITNCDITSSRFDTSPYGNGINATFCQNVKVINSEMARNGLSGIRCAESSQITINNSLAEGNNEHGIFIEKQMNPCKDITIHQNTVQNNRYCGIDAQTAIQLNAKDNRSPHNGKE